MKFKRVLPVIFLSLFIGCTGITRGCSADWIVVQYDMAMTPKACWILRNSSITNESGSDGIYWLDQESGNLVHISGWYNRVQVTRGRFEKAAQLIGVDLDLIKNGKYSSDSCGIIKPF